jgi:hypothetical protein
VGYLNIGKYFSIKDLIQSYLPFDQLKINWVLFGNNGNITNNSSELIPNFTKSADTFDKSCKSLVKVSSVISNNNPHYFILKKGSLVKNLLNNITSNSSEEPEFQKYKINTSTNKMPYIAHYITQDTTGFFNRRFLRDNSTRHLQYSKEFLEHIKNNKDDVIQILHDNSPISPDDKYIVELDKLKDFFNVHNKNNINNLVIVEAFES